LASGLKTVLVVGAGSIGERHIRCFLATERVAVCFVEPKDSLRQQIAQRHPQARGFASLESAMESPVDVAVIATPASLHDEQAIQLVQRGVHLLIEKPLSVTLDRVDELASIARQRKLVVGVAYVYRAHPVLAEMRQAIDDGKFGKPVELVFVSGQNFPSLRPAYRETYYVRRSSGGGAVQDALTHGLNAGQWLVGSADRVVADLAHKLVPGVDVEDTVHVLARQGEVLASYSLNQHQAPNEMTLTVICEQGVARFESHHCRWRSMQTPGDEWQDHSLGSLQRDELFIRQAHSFLDAVEGKAPPLCSLDEAVATLKTNLAILKSAEQGTWVSTA
jgi:predicted dehydrogenase